MGVVSVCVGLLGEENSEKWVKGFEEKKIF